MMLGPEKSAEQVEIYDVSLENQADVKTTAQVIIEKTDLINARLSFIEGVDGEGISEGDVKNTFLDISKNKTLGWKLKHNAK
ncbi:MAG: hypothetical protein QXR63_04980 [Candidatus Bathyarchaeia archaeon]